MTVRLAKSPAAPKVYTVDIEPSMVEYAKQRAVREGLKNVVAVQAGADTDRTNLPESVDLVLVVDTYHLIPNRVAYFTALKARMKQGARLRHRRLPQGLAGRTARGVPLHSRPDQRGTGQGRLFVADQPRLPARGRSSWPTT